MGVSVDTGGKGRGKGQNVDLNLVPFIDFLSCLLAFLMMTAVWSEISAIEHEQLVSNTPEVPETPPDPPPPPPLTVHVTSEGYQIFRKPEDMTTDAANHIVPKIDATDEKLADANHKQFDYDKMDALIKADRDTYPDEKMVVINTDDGVGYEEMIKVLDTTRVYKYEQSALAGGPPTANPLAPPAPTAAPTGG
jgi:biopolymer transport protein ExbD